MAGICFHFNPDLNIREYWSYVFENFNIKELYEVQRPKDIDSNYYNPIVLNSYDELPKERSLVILAHKDAKYLKGKISLSDYNHPQNPVYVFGGDNSNLYPELFEKHKYDVVYIPPSLIEMYSFQAGAITMYDRESKLKNG